MADRTCTRCGKMFSLPCRLRIHERRKTSCAPILDASDVVEQDIEKFYVCKFCNRRFTTRQGRSQHTIKSCKAALSGENIRQLHEYTIQRQADHIQTLETKVREMLGGYPPHEPAATAAAASDQTPAHTYPRVENITPSPGITINIDCGTDSGIVINILSADT